MNTKEYQKQYRAAHREELNAKQRERGKIYYQEHKEETRARNKKWMEEHPDRMKELQQKNREKHLETMKARSKAWYQANKERASRNSRISKLRQYGMTLEVYDAMMEEQKWHCPICGVELSKEETATSPRIDHNHETGKVRGILCMKCNSGLGMFKDSPLLLMRAADYLEDRSFCGPTSIQSSDEWN